MPKIAPEVSEFFETNQDANGHISPTQLSELVDRDPKTVRARLRKMAARDQSELKGARWRITRTVANTVFGVYAKLDEQADAEAEAS